MSAPRADGNALDPRTPVVIGVGQASDPLDRDGVSYRAMSAVQLAAEAANEAFRDTRADSPKLRAAVDLIAAVRQFEVSTPGAPIPLGASDNFPRSVGDLVDVEPEHAILDVTGGHSPQHLINEVAADIAHGRRRAALLVGAEAISTARHFAKAEDRPDFSETRGGQLEDRGFSLDGLMSRYQMMHGLFDAPSQYALFENARRARQLGTSRAAYARSMGELFAPFTTVAARNPHAASPVERDADELATVDERNRMIADPYPRYLVSRDQVNQGAAVLLVSVEVAQELGVPPERWVFLPGHADLRELDLLDRPDLDAAPSQVRAIEHALDIAGITMDDVGSIDLYSCFPIAVSHICDGLGLDPQDSRGLTVTGGLSFFGGAGNNYSMHAIADTVQLVRKSPGSHGLVGANGGTLSKYSVGVYTTTPASWVDDESHLIQEAISRSDPVEVAVRANGEATIETFTIKYGRSGETGIVVGRLGNGHRFLATTTPGDEDALKLLKSEQPVGERIYVRSTGPANRFTTSEKRMDSLHPREPLVLRSDYEFVNVHRDGRLLEVTIDRPSTRNSLTPEANAELSQVFDCFFADRELWVAIITGAGTEAFSAGNDLRYSASGKPVWIPEAGFGGLTSRRHMHKPVIAAVNGFALGGGFEIALACHLVVADTEARFGLTEVNVGLIAGAGGLVRLPRATARVIANEMILTGRQMSAQEALDERIVNRVVPAGTALEGAREMAKDILSSSPTSVRLSLRSMEATAPLGDTVEAIESRAAAKVVDSLLLSADATEGIAAFAERRPPRWTNL